MKHNLQKKNITLDRVECAVLNELLPRVFAHVDMSSIEEMLLNDMAFRLGFILHDKK